ncbi:ficolin-1 [Elysia marginata]|uniref:Ficolin-1 n=1 Tax=Elysia marginata TaxID=1093978 RepID=A0AAV4IF84_9GAST|nr:ficolin-1 [Elysia marginata]
MTLNQKDGASLTLASVRQLITQAVDRLENKMDDAISQLQENLNNQTEAIRDMLVVRTPPSSRDLQDPSNMSGKRSRPSTCYRGMASDLANDTSKIDEKYQTVMNYDIDREVMCDTQTDGGGWILIQRRFSHAISFKKPWLSYKTGFGVPPGDFWLGNDALHNLTYKDDYELRVDGNGERSDFYAQYTSFKVDSESEGYRLRLGAHSGTLGESSYDSGLSYHNGLKFSTVDQDNDSSSRHCAQTYDGGWWYGDCYRANLNGQPLKWYLRSSLYYRTLYSVEMKIRRL